MLPRPKVDTEATDNHLIIAGSVCRGPETRFSPAGIPITRFTLEHRSQQWEAGVPREVGCRLAVMVVGARLQSSVAALALNGAVRVSGFLSRAGSRTAETQLVLHADSIEIL
jgi:primosomal replication protein N